MNVVKQVRHRPFFIKLFNWEYWSFTAVYIWIYPIWIVLCIRARSFFFFAAANPSIKNGGFLSESKKDIAAIIPPQYHPKTVFFTLPSNAGIVLKELAQAGLEFPLIGKPNVGGRGRGVKALRDEQDVRTYVQNTSMDFHIQEFISYKNEVGIFYYRMPGSEKGVISGIVKKEFRSHQADAVTDPRIDLV